MPDKAPLVVIVVLNWNGLQDTLECLDSLSGLEYANVRVVVVDNGSEVNEADLLQASHGWIHAIRSETNRGFAGGNNLGIDYVLGIQADYVLLLNNDTAVTPDLLDRLLGVAEENPAIGLLTPVIYDHTRRDMVQNQGMSIGWYGPPGGPVKIGAGDPFVYIEAALGASLLIKRAVLESIGTLSEEYFYQAEDTDLCARAARQGFKIVVVPSAKIYHKGSVSLNKVPGNKVRYFTRNRFIFRTKYASNLQLSVFCVWFILCEFPMNLIYYLLRFRKVEVIRGLLAGTKEGISYMLANRRMQGRGI